MKAQCRLPAVPAGTKFSEAGVVQRGAKGKGIRLEKPAAVEAEIFIASAHGALLSARARGAPKMFGEIIRPVLGA